MARELGEQDNARVAEIRRQYSAGAPPSALLLWLAEAGVVGADLVTLFAAAFPGAGHSSAIGVWEAGRRNGNADDVLFDERLQSSMPDRGSFSLGQLVPAAQTYQDVRKSYLETTPEDFGLTGETLPYPVFGVLMEVGIEEGLFFLVALADGTTNLHLSNGASTLGAGHHAAVQRATDHLLAGAQHVYALGHPVSEPASPSVGWVAFSFLVAGPPRYYEASDLDYGCENDRHPPSFEPLRRQEKWFSPKPVALCHLNQSAPRPHLRFRIRSPRAAAPIACVHPRQNQVRWDLRNRPGRPRS